MIDRGQTLSSSELDALEGRLVEDPDDLRTRIRLVVHYDSLRFGSGQARLALQRHVKWLIRNHPESAILAHPGGIKMLPAADGDVYTETIPMWLDAVDRHPTDPAVLSNAANSLIWEGRSLCLFRRAMELDPHSALFRVQYAYAQVVQAHWGSPEDRREAATAALWTLQDGLASIVERNDRLFLNTKALKYAVEAGDPEAARTYATEIVAEATALGRDDWNYCNSNHDALQVLGWLALRRAGWLR